MTVGSRLMRVVVKKNGRVVNESHFTTGPIHIGRHTQSHLLLSDKAVSRHHAVIFNTPEGKWMVEDLDSANKTYLNDKPIHKAEIKTGDVLRIVDFTIDINLEDNRGADIPARLDDTITTFRREPQIIVRKPDARYAPDITLPAGRIKDFLQATDTICRANGLDEVVQALLNITRKQFASFRCWCALRNQPSGPMTSYAGKTKGGNKVELAEIKLAGKITEAVEKGQFLLLPQAATQTNQKDICSAMIAPIMDPAGCFGVVYVDNTIDQPPFTLSDLDYLMLLAIHTAAILENF